MVIRRINRIVAEKLLTVDDMLSQLAPKLLSGIALVIKESTEAVIKTIQETERKTYKAETDKFVMKSRNLQFYPNMMQITWKERVIENLSDQREHSQ